MVVTYDSYLPNRHFSTIGLTEDFSSCHVLFYLNLYKLLLCKFYGNNLIHGQPSVSSYFFVTKIPQTTVSTLRYTFVM